MEVNVLFFGQLKDISGKDNLVIHDIDNTDSLVNVLKQKFPGLTRRTYVVAVGNEIIQDNTLLQPNATVALMPAFSGG